MLEKQSKRKIILNYKPLKRSQIVGQIPTVIFNFVLLFRKAYLLVFLVKLMQGDDSNLLKSRQSMTEITWNCKFFIDTQKLLKWKSSFLNSIELFFLKPEFKTDPWIRALLHELSHEGLHLPGKVQCWQVIDDYLTSLPSW